MRCGGLPKNKNLPLGYKKLFALEGLTNEYFGKAVALREGQLLVFDYGYEAAELYCAARTSGTLARYAEHRVDDQWLDSPGEADLTSHVDFTAARMSAEAAGLRTTGFIEQSRFLVDAGLVDRLTAGRRLEDVRQRLQARTLVAFEGLGGTMKLMMFERAAA